MLPYSAHLVGEIQDFVLGRKKCPKKRTGTNREKTRYLYKREKRKRLHGRTFICSVKAEKNKTGKFRSLFYLVHGVRTDGLKSGSSPVPASSLPPGVLWGRQ